MNMFAKGTAQTPEEYLSHIPKEQQEDVKTLHQMILKTLPNAKTALFGQIIGYGTYHYKSKSGREGDWFVIGLSARKKYISVYIYVLLRMENTSQNNIPIHFRGPQSEKVV